MGSVQDLVNQALNHLSFLLNIKGFATFDCQSSFLKADGIRALLGIKAYSTADLFPEGIALQKDQKKLQQIQIHSKIVLQMLSQNEASMIRVYENLIKSVLFIYYTERLKLEEGESPQTPKPKRSALSPLKERPLPKTASKQEAATSKLRKGEYGEALLSDFIAFFDKVMKVQDFRSFLTACQNVCVVKRKAVSKPPPKVADLVAPPRRGCRPRTRGAQKQEEEEKKEMP